MRRRGLPVSLVSLARQLGAEVRNGADAIVDSVAALDLAGPNDLTYLADAKYRKELAECRAGAVIVSPDEIAHVPGRVLVVENPRLAFARAAALIFPEPAVCPGVHPDAIVAPDAVIEDSSEIAAQSMVGAGSRIGARVLVGPGCYIGRDVVIGDDTRLLGRVTVLDGCVVGKRCLVQPGAVLGADGFGYARDGVAWVKVPQLGRVVVGDDVDIGANTTIDRGALGDTSIGNGVKLDNLIQVAHNVRIGEHTAVAACTGIAGSTHIGARCMIGGGVGIGGHLDICDDVTILGRATATTSIRVAGVYSSTMSTQPAAEWRKNAARFRHLDEFVRALKKLEVQVQQLLLGRDRG